MNEVEKMCENCNIKPKQKGYCGWDSNCPYPHHKCNDECPYWKYEDEAKYPPFTAEKQLELIKWLCTNTYRNYFKICFDFKCKTWYMECDLYSTANKKDFTEVLVQVTQCIWQDLTEEEKQQIKNILESEVRE